jgi:transposase
MEFLSSQEEQALRALHRKERDSRVCDRIKAILLSNQGWTYLAIAEALMIDNQTVSRYVFEYKVDKKIKPENGGSSSKLTASEAKELEEYLEKTLYTGIKDICAYVEQTYRKTYTVSGMQSWMRHHNFVYKKPKGIPAKASEEAQEQFKKKYELLMNTTPEDEPILFGDSVHPTQASQLSCGWIRRGKEQYIPTTGARARLNITGAINLESGQIFYEEFEKINGSSFIIFLEKLANEWYPVAPKIHLIVDRGSCHTSKEVTAYLTTQSRIVLHYLPSYSPNLNPIERLWKIMHEYVSKNKYHSTKKDFFESIRNFFNKTIFNIKDIIQSRVTDIFAPLKS